MDSLEAKFNCYYLVLIHFNEIILEFYFLFVVLAGFMCFNLNKQKQTEVAQMMT